LIFLGDYEFAKNVLDSLDHQRANIAHWNRRGGFARQYIELLIIFEKIRHGQVGIFTEVIQFYLNVCKNPIGSVPEKDEPILTL